MCTPKERKLFIEAINELDSVTIEIESYKKEWNWVDWANGKYDPPIYLSQRELEEEEVNSKTSAFPKKDRSLSRKRHHASKRDKAKHYNKNLNKKIRDDRISRSGFNYSKGKSHNQDFLEYLTSLDMESYNTDSIKGNTKDEDIEYVENDNNIYSLFDNVGYYTWDYTTVMEVLKTNLIYVSCELADKIAKRETRKKQRKEQIDNEREICGYEIIYTDENNNDFVICFCKTKNEAETIKESLECEYYYNIRPLLSYTKRQLKEIDELGFKPIPGRFNFYY